MRDSSWRGPPVPRRPAAFPTSRPLLDSALLAPIQGFLHRLLDQPAQEARFRFGVEALGESLRLEDRLGESRDSSHEDQIRITPLGRFVVSELVGTFVYADAVVVDTPITDGSVRAATKDETTIVARVERCRAFKKYLDDCSAALRDADATSFWADVSKALEADINRVTERIGART